MKKSCIDIALEKHPDAERADVEALYESLSEKRAEAFLEGLSNPESKFALKAKRLLENYQMQLIQQDVMKRETIVKIAKLEAFISDPAFGNRGEGLAAAIGGTFKKVEGGRLGVGMRQKAMRNMLRTAFTLKLGDPALEKIFMSGAIEREIMIETENLAKGKTSPITKSAEAFKIAQAVHHVNRLQLQQLRASGVFINDLHGYVMMQGHNPEKLKSVGKEKWVASTLDMLNHDKTFFRDFYKENPIKYLEAVYDDLVNGNADKLLSESLDEMGSLTRSPANMAKKAALGRSLYFKDASMFYEYNKMFGMKTLSEQVYSSMEATARNAAAIERFGSNPYGAIDRLMDGMTQPEKDKIDLLVKQMDGSVDRGGDSPAAMVGRGYRITQRLSKLSMSAISNMNDFVTRALNMNINGKNFFSALGETFSTFIDNLPEAKRRETLELTAVYAETMNNSMYSDLADTDSPVGFMAKTLSTMEKAQDTFFDIVQLRRMVQANTAGNAQALARQVGMHIDKSFADIDSDLGRTLMGYGIGPMEWEIFKHGKQVAEDGRTYVGYGKLSKVSDDVVREILEKGGSLGKELQLRQISKFRQEAQNKLTTYFNDMTSIAMSEAGLKENAYVLKRGMNVDSVTGQLYRSALLFKTFPVTYAMNTVLNSFQRKFVEQNSAGRRAAVTNTLIPFMGATLVVGYVAESAREMLKNKTPADPLSKETIARVITRSGFAGIYGDFLLGEYDSRRGRSFLTAAAGPLGGQIEDLFSMKGEILSEDKPGGKTKLQKVSGIAMKLAASNIPGSNFPPLKAGLDYLLLDHIEKTLQGAESVRERKFKEMKRMKLQGQSPLVGGG